MAGGGYSHVGQGGMSGKKRPYPRPRRGWGVGRFFGPPEAQKIWGLIQIIEDFPAGDGKIFDPRKIGMSDKEACREKTPLPPTPGGGGWGAFSDMACGV